MIVGVGLEVTGTDLSFYNWFYLLLAWIHFSWGVLEPFLDQFDMDLTPNQVEGLGDVAFAGFSGFLVRFGVSIVNGATLTWPMVVPALCVAGLYLVELEDPWLDFTQTQLNLVWIIAMGDTFLRYRNADDLTEQLLISATAWTGFLFYLGTQF